MKRVIPNSLFYISLMFALAVFEPISAASAQQNPSEATLDAQCGQGDATACYNLAVQMEEREGGTDEVKKDLELRVLVAVLTDAALMEAT